MTAYSFRPRFVAPILAGTKRQTIRGHRRRHTRPGEPTQLYTGMRTKACAKILVDDPTCEDVNEIALSFGATPRDDDVILFGCMTVSDLDAFARADGFADWLDMRAFWREQHPGVEFFEGVLIRWRP